MTKTKKPRYEPHNDPGMTHKERMTLRKARRALRMATQRGSIPVAIPGTNPVEYRSVTFLRPLKGSKYDPKTEAEKHGMAHR